MTDCQGYEELSPSKVGNELLGHLQPGDKVAIVTRGGNIAPYLEELRNKRQLQVRAVQFTQGHEAFCFFLKAQKELVGFEKSQFLTWAGYLSSAARVRFYDVDTPASRERWRAWHKKRPFYNHKLKDKISYEVYESEEMEESDLPKVDRGDVGNPFLSF
eukprot:CAMPEP_0172524308 /NCGR_PEP_ID=MMETSP1066-20121228/294119_1 /TAXON_ID=671091 /ORGANISM="Coscinodiscus wailesii, Strain CCMP2513" /LENGTH=158 /DNA_ID=CAMNT_0013307427 /DNA_START=924 /DNA_END=1400 /DNA_ORIENTATION=-